jgi:hypothetical protein
LGIEHQINRATLPGFSVCQYLTEIVTMQFLFVAAGNESFFGVIPEIL